jgi:thioesterase domain-containing protein
LAAELTKVAATGGFAALARKCQDLRLIPEDFGIDDIRSVAARTRAYVASLVDYRPQPIPIPIHLFRALETPDSIGNACRGWLRVLPAKQVRDFPVPGNHVTMLTEPHVATLGKALSDAIHQASVAKLPLSPRHSPLMTIQTGRRQPARPPVFCVPGAAASVTAFNDLAAALGPEWPIHGLQPRGLDGLGIPHSTASAAASDYVRAVLEFHPAGPLHLIGHSFGGWVAYEMAVRLAGAGRTVDSLTIIDSEEPGSSNDGPARERTREEILGQLVELFEQSAERSLDIVAKELAALDEPAQLELLHQRLVGVGLLPRRSTPEVLRGVLRTFTANLQTAYVPSKEYAGPASLVLVRDPKDDEATAQRIHETTARGWRRFARELVVWRSPGNHMTVLEAPHVAALADRLGAILRRGVTRSASRETEGDGKGVLSAR